MTFTVRRIGEYASGVRNLGLIETVGYVRAKLGNRFGGGTAPLVVRSRYADHPLECRRGTSDLDVFAQIFVAREYRCLDGLENVDLVIDCGANVGMSSAYFLSRFPTCHVIAVEPDPGNFAQLQRNLAPYRGRVRTIRSAIWSEAVGLVPAEHPFGDGRQWAQSMRPAGPGETPSLVARDIGSLLAESGSERISILKIDIEGAEVPVFESPDLPWLARTDALVIELHGDRAVEAFQRAVRPFAPEVSHCEELTVCRFRSL